MSMRLDFNKLLGFDVCEPVQGGFKNDAFGSRAGAKVGDVEPNAPALDANLFKSEAFGSRIGAKIGGGEPPRH